MNLTQDKALLEKLEDLLVEEPQNRDCQPSRLAQLRTHIERYHDCTDSTPGVELHSAIEGAWAAPITG